MIYHDPKEPNEDQFLQREIWKEEKRLETSEEIDENNYYADESFDSHRDEHIGK